MSGSLPTPADDIIRRYPADRSRLMDILLAVQHRFGRIDEASILAIAGHLGLHAVEVEDTASFYAFFNREPRGRFRIRLA
jgi:[NiFe] hydrogenase diaphorase moiety large subunit